MEHSTALPLGLRMGEYKILKVLGHGGFGITYLAVDKNLNKNVAIKEYFPNDLAVRGQYLEVMAKTSADQDSYQWGLQQFLNEAKTLATFDHPNIIKVLRFFEMNATAYFVMEYTSGRSLSEALIEIEQDHETVSEEEVKQLFFPLLDALKVVHSKNCLHRDIKPANIYIRDDNSQPVLLDFGAARFSLGQHSKSISAIVTPGYAPVEQYQSSMENQGAWTDIYGLAATMYRLVTGRVPVDAFSRYSALNDSQKDALPSIYQTSNGTFSPPFLTAIMFGLNIQRDQRPQSASEWKAHFSSVAHPAQSRPVAVKATSEFKPEPVVSVLPNTATTTLGKVFEVYSHPTFGYKAVKKGFSWSFFLAGALIPLVLLVLLGIKHMWWHVVGIVAAFIGFALFSEDELLAFLLAFAVGLLYGFQGNEWYVFLLKNKGYHLFTAIHAPNPDAAISLALKDKM